MDSTSAAPRHRRPRPSTPHQSGGPHATAPPSAAAGRGLRTPSEHTASPPSPAETTGSSSAGRSPTRALAERCSRCEDGGRDSTQRGDVVRRDNWILGKAVAATWGAGEWLGLALLRKRRGSGSSSLSCEPGVTSPGLPQCRDSSIEGGPLPSPLAASQTPPPYSENNDTTTSGTGFCGSKSSACRKQRRPPFCWWDRGRSGGRGSGGGGGSDGSRLVVVLFGAGVLAVVVSLAWVVCLAASEFYIRTYCLQVRVMEASQRLPRGECPIVKLTRESRGGWGTAPRPVAGTGGGGVEGGALEESAGSAAGAGEGERLRFGIILMCDEGMWPQEYSERSIANKQGYAALHGYDVIIATADDIDRSRPAAWSKLLVLQKHLGSYDYVIFVDIDAFIMNPAFKLEWIVDVAEMQKETGRPDAWGAGRESDLIVTQDWNGPNSGVILIRNTDFSRWLLQEWWDQKQFVHGDFPFQYEQRAMHFLLQTEVWKERGLPFYADFEMVRARTAVIDQCVMNSYLVHPWQVLMGRTTLGTPASYEPGDFMLHFAGKKGRVRLSLVDYYYPRAEQAMEELAASWKSKEGATAKISRMGSGGGGGGGGVRSLTAPKREAS
eukprot:g8490.t1